MIDQKIFEFLHLQLLRGNFFRTRQMSGYLAIVQVAERERLEGGKREKVTLT